MKESTARREVSSLSSPASCHQRRRKRALLAIATTLPRKLRSLQEEALLNASALHCRRSLHLQSNGVHAIWKGTHRNIARTVAHGLARRLGDNYLSCTASCFVCLLHHKDLNALEVQHDVSGRGCNIRTSTEATTRLRSAYSGKLWNGNS